MRDMDGCIHFGYDRDRLHNNVYTHVKNEHYKIVKDHV